MTFQRFVNAAISNSKLLKGFLEWNSGCTFLGFQQSSLHVLALQQIGGFFFRLNLPTLGN
jgi:hypothetical protein